MKKTLAVLATILSITAAFAAPLSIKEGNLDAIQLYAPDGSIIDSASDITGSGFIIRATEGGQVFSCDFGDIHIGDDATIAVTGFTVSEPSLYLLDGSMNIVLPGDEITLSVYTPTTLYMVSGPGEYAFSSTAEAESFANFSDTEAYAYDSIFAKEIGIPAMSGLDLMSSPVPEAVSEEEYHAASVLGTISYPAEPEEEAIAAEPEEEAIAAEPEEEALPADIITEDVLGYKLTFAVGDGMTTLSYPSIVTDQDVIGFMAYESEKHPADAAAVSYAIGDGETVLEYPEAVSRAAVRSYIPVFVSDIEEYVAIISQPAVPSAPAMEAPEQVLEPESVTEDIMGYELVFTIGDGWTVLSYPSIVTDQDVIGFMAYESAKHPADAAAVSYAIGDGETVLEYPEAVSRADVRSCIPVFVSDIEEYISLPGQPAAPEKPAMTEPVITIGPDVVIEHPMGYEIVFTIEDGRTTLSYPPAITAEDVEAFMAYESTKHPADAAAVSYSIGDSETVLEYPASVSRDEVRAYIPVFTSDIEEYIGIISIPAATAGEEGTAAVPVSGEDIPSPYITGQDIRPEFLFDLGLKGRAYADSLGNVSVAPALELAFYYGGFSAAFNIDPIHIASITNLLDNPDADAFSWVGWASDFIEYISFRTIDESVTLNLDRFSFLSGDSLGLYAGLDHNWDGKDRALTFEHTFSSTYYSHRIWFDDLSFRRDPVWSTGGLSFTFGFSESYPASITLEGMARINRDDIALTEFYPEASLFIPFYASGNDYIGLSGGAATLFVGDWNVNPFTENGYLAFASIPMSFSDFYAEVGAGYSTGYVHYGSVGNGSYDPVDGQLLTFYGALGYNGSTVGAGVRGWFDLDVNTLSYISENSFIDAYAYLNIYSSFTIFGGVQSYLLDGSYDPSFYAGFSAAAGPLDAYFKAMYKDRAWSFSVGGRISALGVGREIAESYEKQAAGVDITTGFRYDFDMNRTVFDVMPAIRIGDRSLGVTLRAPLQLAFSDDGSIRLEGFNGHSFYNFGASEMNEERKVWAIYSDTLSIIDGLYLGKEGDPVYLVMDRDYARTSTLFSGYGTAGDLAFAAGFSFPVLDISLYVDDAAAPHLGEFFLTILPGGLGSVAIRLGTSMNFLYQDKTAYSLEFHPELRIDVPIGDFSLSAFVLGSAGLDVADGTSSSYLIYSKEAGAAYDWMAGAEAAYRGGFFDIILTAGYRTGALGYGIYDELGSFRKTPYDITSPSADGWFGRIEIATRIDWFYLSASYYIDNLVEFGRNPAEGSYSDTFTARIGADLENADIYARFARKGFARSLLMETPFLSYMSSDDTLFALGAELRYGNVSFLAELGLSIVEEEGAYMNIPSAAGQHFQLKLGTRFGF